MKIPRFFSCALLLLVFSLPLAAQDRVADASSGKVPPPGDMVLFPLDDYSLPWRDNLKLTLKRPKKFPGNPVLDAGPSGGVDGHGALLYGTVLKQGSKFRMWYLACPDVDKSIPGDAERMRWYKPVAYAESTDGIHWEKPDLGLVEFHGSKHNNLVGIQPDSEPYARPLDFVAVYYEPDLPDADQRFKMAYITQDMARASSSTVTATSADGLHWNLVNTSMITKGHFENSSLIKFDGIYYLSGQNIPPFDAGLPDGSPAGRVMKIFFSPDFHHWSNGRALGFYRNGYETKPEGSGQETHMGAGQWVRGNVILGLYGRWYGDSMVVGHHELNMDLGLLVSNDAIHYREPVRDFIVIPRGSAQDWDFESLGQGNAFANTDTETYIWYHRWGPTLSRQNTMGGVGLATMPRDRFGYFSKLLPVAKDRKPEFNIKRDASCLSRSLQLPHPARLYVNVSDVSPSAALEIALVDDAEQALPGYSAHLSADSLKAPVTWEGKETLPVDTPFRVKVTWPVDVDNAKLYAIYIEQQ